MEPYAVVETGGKQYRVEKDAVLVVELLDAEVGNKVELAPVLACSDGKELRVGAPDVPKAKVVATVLEHKRGEKVFAFRKRRRKGFRRKVGHRQEQTVLKVEEIAG
ncbi:MAG: 50S ribosomal protein L21 [Lentisphaerae bacterium]|nr:50S ribosomal protein L21 [Lentisphaerota bacterium]